MALITIVNPATLSVNFEELAGFPRLTDGEDVNPSLVTAYKVAWADAVTLLTELRGTQSGNVIRVRTLPHEHPYRKGLLFKEGELGPLDPLVAGATNPDGDDRFHAYTYARIDCTYAFPPFPVGDPGSPEDAFVQESFNPRAEMITLPVANLYWDDGQAEALVDAEAPQKVIRMADWNFTDTWREEFPEAVLDLMGTVNDANVTAPRLNRTFAEDTLLYQPPRAVTVLNADGVQGWRLDYNITYKPTGWQNVWHNGAWQRIYDAAGDPLDIYEQGDFAEIIP